jgi:hypothetical protein
MIKLQDISSLTEFHRHSREHIKRLRATSRPAVLTINGRTELVVQHAIAYQKPLDRRARDACFLWMFALFVGQGMKAQGQSDAQAPSTPQGGVSASQLAKANNPLADLNAVNFQNYFSPSLYGVSGESSNTMNLRPVIVAGRHIVRATLPVQTTPVGQVSTDLVLAI